MLAYARKPQLAPATVETVHMPAPVGGLNTIDPASSMPATDCIYVYNMIAAEYGLRSRLGYEEWCTTLTNAAGNEVRTVMGFSGGHQNGSTDKLFACTQKGIWDVSASTSSPSRVVTFGTVSGDAGYGVAFAVSTAAGRFLFYCDEENGLYIYTENSATWAKISSGTTQAWSASTAYAVGNRVVNGGKVYTCSTSGISASSGGPTGTGTAISDGTAAWDYVSASSSTVIGPSLADQNVGFAADPAKFVAGTVWKSRVLLVEKDSSRGWYLGTNSIYGTATSFDFGVKMKSGGPLVGLYNWSTDGGSGMDTSLVGISTAGDVVVYQGTDPASASTFGLKGCWSVGGVPKGRRIATDYGGDLLILSLLGVIPLSKLEIGSPIVDRTQYATAKISNLFNLLASASKTLPGWALHIHPTDNALVILIPTQSGQATQQLAMSFATRSWSRYRDLPMLSAGVWNGQLYFGTTDGRVCINTGYVDGVSLANPNSYSPVAWSLLTAYQNLGNARQKQVEMIRPSILSESTSPSVKAYAKYGFDISEPAPPSGVATGSSGAWDGILWDSGVWGGEYTPAQPLGGGGGGMGREVAIAVRGNALARTTLVGMDVFFNQGGLL